eukprot:3416361-Alexandrium_andersonii.AAC.1
MALLYVNAARFVKRSHGPWIATAGPAQLKRARGRSSGDAIAPRLGRRGSDAGGSPDPLVQVSCFAPGYQRSPSP